MPIFPMTDSEWRAMCEAVNFRCYWCGRPTWYSNIDPARELTKDHLVPESLGGDNSVQNIVPACITCNRLRSCADVGRFLKSRRIFSQSVEAKQVRYTCKSFKSAIGLAHKKNADIPLWISQFAENFRFPEMRAEQRMAELRAQAAEALKRDERKPITRAVLRESASPSVSWAWRNPA